MITAVELFEQKLDDLNIEIPFGVFEEANELFEIQIKDAYFQGYLNGQKESTIFSQIDSKAISHLKNEIKQNQILINNLENSNKLQYTTWDTMNENICKIMDYEKNIEELEKKTLAITFKYF